MEDGLEKWRYPIGRSVWPEVVSAEQLIQAVESISTFPARMREAVSGMPVSVLDMPYRPGGWTLRQLVHHCADSHINAYVRYKLALTEDAPVIKPYLEAAWAELPDSRMAPDVSLQILEFVHVRWTVLMQSLSDRDWDRGFFHPEYQQLHPLRNVTVHYAWHGEHHLAHVRNAVERQV